MNKKYLFLTVLLLASAIVVAGVQGITAVMGSSEDESMEYRQLYENALTVSQAIEICESTGTTQTAESYYVRGTVSRVTINSNYGTATVILSETSYDKDSGEETTTTFQLYQLNSFNGEKFTEDNIIQTGDEVIACGPLVNYKGTTPEMNKGYLVAVNGSLGWSSGETPEEPETIPDTITIYVNSVVAPYLYTWGNKEIAMWPGIQMTKQKEVAGAQFWYMEIPVIESTNIIFNDGNGNQTVDINGIKEPRYYWYNGLTDYEDVTEEVLNGEYRSRDYIVTALINNPDFRNGLNGWTCENIGNDYSVAASQGGEFYFYQDVKVPTAGLYEVQVNGYQESDFYDNSRNVSVYLYANNNETAFKNVYDESINGETRYQWEKEGAYFDTNEYCTNDECRYYPYWYSGAQVFFQKGYYSNSVFVYVANDNDSIRLGVKSNNTQNNYAAYWKSFKLYNWGMDAEKAGTALSQTIQSANQLLENHQITAKGKQVLTAAIAEATAALEAEDAATKIAAIDALNKVVENVKANYMYIVKTFSVLYNSNYTYYNDNDTVDFDEVKLVFHRNNGNQPYSRRGYIYLYNGNTMTMLSEMDMVDIQFPNNMGQASEGTLVDGNHWTGNTTELTFAPNEYQINFNSFTVTFDNPTDEELVERLTDQITLSEAAIAALAHQAVSGKDALSQKITEAKALTTAAELDIPQIKAYTLALKADTQTLQDLDAAYTNIETALTALATAGQDNQYVDAAKQEAATTFITATQADIAQGAYEANDIAGVMEKIAWHTAQLQMVYLTIQLADEGTLGDEILSRVTDFTDVQGLRISGKVNSEDMNRIKNQLTNLQEIDMSGLNLKSIPREQFNGREMITSVKLPATLETIEYEAFYNCKNMESFELPATLKTIGNYAFYNCRQFTELVVPEGVTSIGDYAFDGTTESSYAYDENGKPMYDEYGNHIYVYRGSNLKKVTLPSTLTYLGNAAFRNCVSLEEVNIPEGLTELQSNLFRGCTALKNITIPTNIKKINSQAFYNAGLENVELSEGLNILQSNAFGYCKSLKTITLPSSVNSVYNPFYGCSSLDGLVVKAIAPPYANESNIMGGNEQQCTLYVPALSLAAYKQTDQWSNFAPNIFGLNIMPENIIISDQYRLLWPDTVSFDYKPNVELTKMDRGDSYYYSSRYRYAAVTVTGNATLSAKEFSMYWDYYFKRESNSSSESRFATLLNNGKIRTDNNILKLHLRADEWNFITLPFDVKVSDIVNVNNTQFVIRGYDVKKRADSKMNETWYNMTGNDTLQAGKGYIWQGAHTVDVNQNYNNDIEFDVQALQTVNKNNMFANSTVEIELEENLSEFPQNRSWNFIGNPFPCYFDTRAIDCTAPITIWQNGYQYRAYSPVDDKYILAPGEAFFIQRPLDQASITFLREGRQLTPEAKAEVNYFAAARQSEMTAKRSVFNLKVAGNEQNDQTRFVINENALLEYEMDKDASKFMDATVKGIQFYTIENGLCYAINERPLAAGEVALGMKVEKAGSYTITLDTTADAEVYLIDLLTGQEILLGEGGYTFQVEAGTFDGRFLVRLVSSDLTGISTVSNDQQQDGDYYDLQGRRVEKGQLKNGIYVKKGLKAVVK